MTAPWALRIKIRRQHAKAQTYQTRDGYEVRLSSKDAPLASGRSRDEAWQRAWDALNQRENGR